MDTETQLIQSENSFDLCMIETLGTTVEEINKVVNEALNKPFPALPETVKSGSLIWGDGRGLGAENLGLILALSLTDALVARFDMSALGGTDIDLGESDVDFVTSMLVGVNGPLVTVKAYLKALNFEPMTEVAVPEEIQAWVKDLQPAPYLASEELASQIQAKLLSTHNVRARPMVAGFDLRMTAGVVDRLILLYLADDSTYRYSEIQLGVQDV